MPLCSNQVLSARASIWIYQDFNSGMIAIASYIEFKFEFELITGQVYSNS